MIFCNQVERIAPDHKVVLQVPELVDQIIYGQAVSPFPVTETVWVFNPSSRLEDSENTAILHQVSMDVRCHQAHGPARFVFTERIQLY